MDLKTPFYAVNNWYSVTLNPDDKHQFVGKADRVTSFKNFIYENVCLILATNHIRYHFSIEISETKEGNYKKLGPRLHLHGRIMFDKNLYIKHFLVDILPQWLRFSQIEIDTINDLWYWDNYCHKQQHIMAVPRLSNSALATEQYKTNTTTPRPNEVLPGIIGAAEPLAPKRSETGEERDPLEAHVESEAPHPPLYYYFPPEDGSPLLVIDSVTGIPIDVKPIPIDLK